MPMPPKLSRWREMLTPGAGFVEPVPLDAEWRDGDLMVWRFQRPTRVFFLELRGDLSGAVLLSVKVAGEEQCTFAATGGAPVIVLALPAWRMGRDLPAENWAIGALVLPSFGVNEPFEVEISGFRGELRPHGQQVPA